MQQATNRDVTRGKSKHNEIRHSWLKDYIDSGNFEIKHLTTEDMIADVLTEPQQGKQYRRPYRMAFLLETRMAFPLLRRRRSDQRDVCTSGDV